MEAHKTVSMNKKPSKGAWSQEEDRKLAEAIAINGARRWRSIAIKAGLNRCGKSCRLRWMNYLRPNIKRGNISDQEEDLILRLHKLLGNRWSLIAGRLPGRTDNEIKNYWNSHLSKKTVQIEKSLREEESISKLPPSNLNKPDEKAYHEKVSENKTNSRSECKDTGIGIDSFDVDDLFDFSTSSFPSYDWFSEILLPEESL